MPLDLDRLEQRIVGVLIEKQLTVPDSYPLTLNALVAGCNQKSNRDPTMSVEPYEVEGALRSLMERGWVREVDMAGSRVHKYRHHVADQLAVGVADQAILAELLVRGPQAPGALKTRTDRMHPASSPDEIEERLRELAARPIPYVEELERRPRERAARWAHCLGRTSAEEGEPEPAPSEPAPCEPAPCEPAPCEPAPSEPVAPSLGERVDALEQQLADVVERLRRLEGPG